MYILEVHKTCNIYNLLFILFQINKTYLKLWIDWYFLGKVFPPRVKCEVIYTPKRILAWFSWINFYIWYRLYARSIPSIYTISVFNLYNFRITIHNQEIIYIELIHSVWWNANQAKYLSNVFSQKNIRYMGFWKNI